MHPARLYRPQELSSRCVLFCLFVVLGISVIACRLRRYIRFCSRRLTRFSPKRDRDLLESSMEKGGDPAYGDSPISYMYPQRLSFVPSSPRWWRHLHRMTPMWHRHRSSERTNQNFRPLSRVVPPSPARASPMRPSPSSTLAQQSEFGSGSTSGSPTFGNYDDYFALKNGDAGEASSISAYSRSRNSSTISLSVLVPRQPLSRTASMQPLP